MVSTLHQQFINTVKDVRCPRLGSEAAKVALSATVECLGRSEQPERVVFVLFDKAAYAVYTEVWSELRLAGD